MMTVKSADFLVATCLCCLLGIATSSAQDTIFTYQGELNLISGSANVTNIVHTDEGNYRITITGLASTDIVVSSGVGITASVYSFSFNQLQILTYNNAIDLLDREFSFVVYRH